MKSAAALLLPLIGLSRAAFPRRSTEGVPLRQLAPAVSHPQDDFDADCVRVGDGQKPSHPWLRPFTGAMVRQEVWEKNITDNMGDRNKKQLIFEAKDKRTADDMERCVLGDVLTLDKATGLLQTGYSFGDAHCKCLGFRAGASNCELRETIHKSIDCPSFYVADNMCTGLDANTFGVDIPSLCRGTTTFNIPITDLMIENVLYPFSNEVPEKIDAQNIDNEGRVYYLAWKWIRRVTMFAESSLGGCSGGPDDVLIDDHENKMYFTLKSPRPEDPEPVFAVLTQKGPSSWTLFLRDALTNFEAELVHQTEQSDWMGTKVHSGFRDIASLITPRLESFFHSILGGEDGWDPVFTKAPLPRLMIVADGALGGGVGSLVATRMIDFFRVPKYGNDFRVDAILFNAPRVGDGDFVDLMRKRVNFRTIGSKHLTSTLCSAAPVCSKADEFGNVGTSDTYPHLGGFVEIDSQLDLHFRKGGFDLKWLSMTTAASFGCQRVGVIDCWASKYCRDDDHFFCKDVEACGVQAP